MDNFKVLFKDESGSEFEYSIKAKDLWEVDTRAKELASKMGWVYISII